jgi:hypothetical protein
MTNLPRLLALLAIASAATACVAAGDPSVVHVDAALCEQADSWQEWTPYAAGDVVIYDGVLYGCVQGHTSQPDWTPDVVPALWAPAICDGGGGGGGGGGGDDDGGDDDGGGGGGGGTAAGFIFTPYKDTSINMDWNLNVISTSVSGTRTPLAADMAAHDASAVTLAFATGECGSEGWGGVPGAAMATANVSRLVAADVDYMLATGGAAGSFSCGSDAGFATFLDRWVSPNLIGVDFDIEVGQSQAQIVALAQRAAAAHASYPGLRFSFTIATLAGTEPGESLNATGVQTVEALEDVFGTLPAYVTVNLMTMDYGGGSPFICVVGGDGRCDMGLSAAQAARNLHTNHGIPFANIELTPMIGGNDVQANVFNLGDVDEMSDFIVANGLAGAHHWSYDRDVDCPAGSASPVCNSLGGVGAYGFLDAFNAAF